MKSFLNETNDTIALKNVYDHIQDEESRNIYMARSMYSLSDNKNYMKDIVRKCDMSMEIYNSIVGKNKLVLFGAGTWGEAITYYLDDIHWDYVIDNKIQGNVVNGYKINKIDEIKQPNEYYYIVACMFKWREIENQLIDRGIPSNNILILGKLVEEKQYFDLSYLKLGGDEVFLDVGGYNGDTTQRFLEKTGNKYDSIYILEPNKFLAAECREKNSKYKNCYIIEKGAWNKSTKLRFNMAEAGSTISDSDNEIIETISIDELLGGKRASYIKMDIEGAELQALLGAEQTIRKYKPKLAISVYHNRYDIWDIPKLVLSYNNAYKLYFRTYSYTGNDTIMYAL